MRLSWIGKSAVIAAGVILMVTVMIQAFWPVLFDLDRLHLIWIGYPLMLIASYAVLKFLRNTKAMSPLFRLPWESYSWSVLLFTGGTTVYLLFSAFDLIYRNEFFTTNYALLIPYLALFVSYWFIFLGLNSENKRITNKEPKSVMWIFVLIAAGLFVLGRLSCFKPIPYIERISSNIAFLLIPLYMCVSVIRKNEGNLALIYKYILISQLAFIFLDVAFMLTKADVFQPLQIALMFFSFAIVFDLRLSLFLSEQKAICIETETPNQVEVEP